MDNLLTAIRGKIGIKEIFEWLKKQAEKPLPAHRWEVEIDDDALPHNSVTDHKVGGGVDGIWATWDVKFDGKTTTYKALYNPAKKSERIFVDDVEKFNSDINAKVGVERNKAYVIIHLTYKDGDDKHHLRFEGLTN